MLLGLSVVKNEADIIEAMVRNNLAYVDHIHLIDNGSTDGTAEIIAALASETEKVTFESNPVVGHRQKMLINEFITNAAGRYSPNHIILVDGDELLAGDPAKLRELCSDLMRPVQLNWKTFVPTKEDDLEQENPVKRICHRREIENPKVSKVTFPGGLIGKAWVGPGSHKIVSGGVRLSVQTTDQVNLAHYPVRTPRQVMSKALIGHWNLKLRGAGKKQGKQWHQIAAKILTEGEFSRSDFLDVASNYVSSQPQPLVAECLWTESAPDLRYLKMNKGSLFADILPFVEQIVTELGSSDLKYERSRQPGRPIFDDLVEETLPENGKLAHVNYQGKAVRFCVSHPRDIIQACHLNGHFYEEDELAIISRHFQRGSVFLDVGSNVGNHSIYVGMFLQPSRIVVIEPNPDAVATLRINIDLNDLSDVCDISHLGIGLGAESGEGFGVNFRRPRWKKKNLGGATLVAGDGDIAISTGDAVLAGLGADFIKIDVEGMEMQVLKGLQDTINSFAPVLFVEVDNQNADEIREWQKANNYSVIEEFSRYPTNRNLLLKPND